jgi:hypothetical protein
MKPLRVPPMLLWRQVLATRLLDWHEEPHRLCRNFL